MGLAMFITMTYKAYAKWCQPGKNLEEYMMQQSCQRSYDHSHVTDHYLPILQTNTCCMLIWLGIPFFRMRDCEQLHAAVGPKNGAWCNWWPDMYFLSKHIVLGRLLVSCSFGKPHI